MAARQREAGFAAEDQQRGGGCRYEWCGVPMIIFGKVMMQSRSSTKAKALYNNPIDDAINLYKTMGYFDSTLLGTNPILRPINSAS
ncbi:hypothetical protein NKDENANG_00388 [Candidatus Entotheonellaceae bacterium PAL068K]